MTTTASQRLTLLHRPLFQQDIQLRLMQNSYSAFIIISSQIDYNNEIICFVPVFEQILEQVQPSVKTYSNRETY